MNKRDDAKRERAKLAKFNREMKAKIQAIRLSPNIKVSTRNIDTDFAALADTNYMK